MEAVGSSLERGGGFREEGIRELMVTEGLTEVTDTTCNDRGWAVEDG